MVLLEQPLKAFFKQNYKTLPGSHVSRGDICFVTSLSVNSIYLGFNGCRI